ncbi:MAG: hypothetical protein PSX36_00410 [bacterium]|nr:hypothetical protein [bacterium]
MKKALYIISLLSLIVFSCVKKEVPQTEGLLGLEYYPLTQGKFVIYDIDSTVYTELPKDTFTYKYLIKEKIADSYTDNEGNTAYRMERFIKKFNPAISYENMPWTIKEVWMLTATNKHIQMLENNMRYTKLIFPIQEKASWNGNSANTLPERVYSYDYVDRTEVINNNKFSNVLRVKQLYYSTLISLQDYSEKYGKDLGLISREITDLLSNTIDPSKDVKDRIESGIIYKQTVLTYGYE